jgi:hypothetical protein
LAVSAADLQRSSRTGCRLTRVKARPAGLSDRPVARSRPRPRGTASSPLFHHVEIRHRQALRAKSGTRSQVRMPARIQCDHGNFVVVSVETSESKPEHGGSVLALEVVVVDVQAQHRRPSGEGVDQERNRYPIAQPNRRRVCRQRRAPQVMSIAPRCCSLLPASQPLGRRFGAQERGNSPGVTADHCLPGGHQRIDLLAR